MMMPRPVILITPSTQRQGVEFSDASVSLSNRYPQAVLASGGVPWVLPCLPAPDLVREAVRRCDGLMLTGGDDVRTELYATDVPARLKKTVSAAAPERDLFELMLINESFRQRKPILAICRGHQILNVALGGTLIVDILSQVPQALRHNQPDRKAQPVHEVALTQGSLLANITGKRKLSVNSTHHQAVGRVAGPLQITALSADGIIEGLELKPELSNGAPFVLSIQFHPERLFDRYRDFLELFRSFTRACAARRNPDA
jgi:putative glutamine amidotransferase